MRNYKKESDWQKQKYDIIKASIDKELGTELRSKLKSEDRTIAGWITSEAKKYLKKGE